MTQNAGFHPPERRTPPKRVDKPNQSQEQIGETLETFGEDHAIIASSLLAIALKATDQEVPQGLRDHLKELGEAYVEEDPNPDSDEQTDEVQDA